MFTSQNYPKSYGNTKKGFYRLGKLGSSQKDLEKIEGQFWKFILNYVNSKKSRKVFKKYPFVNAGWEWSVFRKDDQTVVKVPALIFPEVSNKQYLQNTEHAYQKILNYFPASFLAKSKFSRVKSINIVEQEDIKGKDSYLIGYNTKNQKLLSNLKIFLGSALKMLDDYEWLPDFDIKRTRGGFRLRNVVLEEKTFVPKIIDFTAYYDIYRLYPQRKAFEIASKRKMIQDFLSWLNK